MSAQSLRLSRPSIKIGETTIHIRQRATSLPSAAQGGRKPGKGRRRRRRTLPLAGNTANELAWSNYEMLACEVRPLPGDICISDRYGVYRQVAFAAPRGFRPAIGSTPPVETVEHVRPRNRSERISKYAAAMQRREKTFAPV